MNTTAFLRLVLAAACVASSSGSLRGSTVPATAETPASDTNANANEDHENSVENKDNRDDAPEFAFDEQRHRHLEPGETCNLVLRAVEHGPDVEHSDPYNTQDWGCILKGTDSKVRFVEIVNHSAGSPIFAEAVSGKSVLVASEAIVDTIEPKMYIPRHASVELQEEPRNGLNEERRVDEDNEPVDRVMNALVVRVSAKDSSPPQNVKKLQNDVFLDEHCLSSQFEACSYGKLKINPYEAPGVDGGVIEVALDYNLADNDLRGVLQSAAYEAATEKVGNLMDDKFDLVLFCMPPGTGSWMAYAFVGTKFSFYNDKWCSYVSAHLHEVGHNLGLAHSGQHEESEYSDQSGAMGFSYGIDDQQICFNPAKNYQLGWYKDKVVDYNPLTSNKTERIFTLNGVADYETGPSDANISVRLEQDAKVVDWYIGYMRKTGITQDIVEDGDKVTVLTKDAGFPNEYGLSTKHAALGIGDSYVIQNFNGKKNRDVRITYSATKSDGRDAIVTVADLGRHEDSPTEPCAVYTVELRTDNFPEDNSWTVFEHGGQGRAYGSSPDYSDANTDYTHKLCLPYETEYKFVITDVYSDGICCNQGEGSYRIKDPNGGVVAQGGQYSGGNDFHVEEHVFTVGPNPNADLGNPLNPDNESNCADTVGKFQWHKKKKKKKKWKNCNWIAKKNKCKKPLPGVPGKLLSTLCPRACNTCGDV